MAGVKQKTATKAVVTPSCESRMAYTLRTNLARMTLSEKEAPKPSGRMMGSTEPPASGSILGAFPPGSSLGPPMVAVELGVGNEVAGTPTRKQCDQIFEPQKARYQGQKAPT